MESFSIAQLSRVIYVELSTIESFSIAQLSRVIYVELSTIDGDNFVCGNFTGVLKFALEFFIGFHG